MDRKEAIKTIEMLYPADDSEIGEKLLFKAICKRWRFLPEYILVRYAMLCLYEDEKS